MDPNLTPKPTMAEGYRFAKLVRLRETHLTKIKSIVSGDAGAQVKVEQLQGFLVGAIDGVVDATADLSFAVADKAKEKVNSNDLCALSEEFIARFAAFYLGATRRLNFKEELPIVTPNANPVNQASNVASSSASDAAADSVEVNSSALTPEELRNVDFSALEEVTTIVLSYPAVINGSPWYSQLPIWFQTIVSVEEQDGAFVKVRENRRIFRHAGMYLDGESNIVCYFAIEEHLGTNVFKKLGMGRIKEGKIYLGYSGGIQVGRSFAIFHMDALRHIFRVVIRDHPIPH